MLSYLLISIRATIVFGLLLGIFFPLVVTVIAQFAFPNQANGSLLRGANGKIIGSRLLGQDFKLPKYFHSRPSAAGSGYSGEMSSGSNLGPTSKKLLLGQADDSATKEIDESFLGVKQLVDLYRTENQMDQRAKVPVDAVTRSGSGLDPDISLANALLQARRVAQSRGVPLPEILSIISREKEQRQFGLLGEPRLNVLMLNLSLDRAKN